MAHAVGAWLVEASTQHSTDGFWFVERDASWFLIPTDERLITMIHLV